MSESKIEKKDSPVKESNEDEGSDASDDNPFESLSSIFRKLAGEMEDLSADDATWGCPNVWGQMMTDFSDISKDLEEKGEEYLHRLTEKKKRIFHRRVKRALNTIKNATGVVKKQKNA